MEVLHNVNPEATSLRDISIEELNQVKKDMPEIIYKRCKYVIEENRRVMNASMALKEKDIEKLGGLMFETHKGLSDLYEVSCKELDLLVDLAKDKPSIIGSRLMGGGFGGCTINLIKTSETTKIIEEINKEYKDKTGTELISHQVQIADGVKKININ